MNDIETSYMECECGRRPLSEARFDFSADFYTEAWVCADCRALYQVGSTPWERREAILSPIVDGQGRLLLVRVWAGESRIFPAVADDSEPLEQRIAEWVSKRAGRAGVAPPVRVEPTSLDQLRAKLTQSGVDVFDEELPVGECSVLPSDIDEFPSF